MNEKKIAGEMALEYVKDGMTVGLGTGSTVYYTIMKLGEMVEKGLNITAVSTSRASTELAESIGIHITSIDKVDKIDITIDGADEIDRELNGIKGGGGALFFEKIVDENSEKVIWVADSGKMVESLGKFPLPVEVSKFGYVHLMKKFELEGLNPVLREKDGKTYITDSGNYIIDLHMEEIKDPVAFEKWLNMIPGVVENGLFIQRADIVIVGKMDGAEIHKRQK